MGGMMMLGTAMAASSALGSIAGGRAEQKAYEAEAKMAEMQAEQEEIGRRRELNDALAMQAVMFAAQGRAAGEGSAKQIVQTDIKRAGEDIKLIQAGARSKSAGLRAAGRSAKVKGYTQALSGAGQTAFSAYQAGAFKSTPTSTKTVK